MTPPPDTRTRLLEAARALFVEHGFAEASTRAIASKAGCNLAMISHYFGSKEGLFKELMLELLTRLEQNFRTQFSGPGTFEAKVHAFVDGMVDTMDENAPLMRAMNREIASPDHPFLTEILPTIKQFKASFHKLLEDAREAGTIRKDLDPEMCGFLLGGMIQHYFALYPTACQVIGPRTDARVAELKRHIAAIFLGGVVQRP